METAIVEQSIPPTKQQFDVSVASDSDDAYQESVEWTEEEEKRLVRKIDSVVMPLLVLAFMALQYDRGNIGNALTDYFFEDVGITQTQFNVGQQLLSLGIVLFEIPSNYILYRVGPSVWLSGQIFAFGLVSTFQAFQHGVGAFMATRFLLGMCESGYIPGGLYTITRFYKKDETSKRFSIYFIGNMFATATSGIIAYGILHMRGICGLGGWQWLFIASKAPYIEGLFTVTVGLIFLAFFPKSVSNPVSFLGIRFFSERESRIMVARVVRDDPRKRQIGSNVTREEMKATFTNPKWIPHIILTVCGLAPVSTLVSYSPTLVKGMGYGRLESNAYASIGPFMQLVMNVFWGIVADKIRMRGPIVLLGASLWFVFSVGCRAVIYSPNNQTQFGLLTSAVAFSFLWHPINGSWMALNAQSAGERSMTMAILIMSANTAGIIGSQLFQEADAPYYPIGWSVIVALIAVSVTSIIIANVQYVILNRRNKKRGEPVKYHH